MKQGVILFFLFTLTSCTINNEEDYFSIVCDSENVYYIDGDLNQSISNIISNKCLACHVEGNTISYVSLETYDDLKAYSNLDEIINNIANPMPPEGSVELTDCEKLQIESWVSNKFLEHAEY